MAVGGEPNLSSFADFAENLQEQTDEILVLESIFEGDEGRLQVLSRASPLEEGDDYDISEAPGNALKIMIPISPLEEKLNIDVYLPLEDDRTVNGPPREAKLARSESGHRVIWSFAVSHLHPLCLNVTLPPTYPSCDAPSFHLSCLWLSPSQLTVVCQQLDRLWMEVVEGGGQGMPILYTWVDWLQENLLSFLSIQEQISISTHVIDEDVDDCRVYLESTDMDYIVTTLMRYNRDKEMVAFYQSSHECGICFLEYPGSEFLRLSGCGHYVCRECLTTHCQLKVQEGTVQSLSEFLRLSGCGHFVCRECLTTHCQLKVQEGTVQSLRCPLNDCEESIPPVILQAVLTKEEFQRFQTLALQKALDTMGDITYCPRCNAAVVQEPEEDLNLAHCLSCFYSFCTDCQEAWHQGVQCKYLLEMKEKKAIEIGNQQTAQQAAIERQKRKMEDNKSKEYVHKMASQCPGCKAKIMKISGCNKVACTMCGRYMCWCCKSDITSEGYGHFSDNQKCNTFEMQQEMVDNTDIGIVQPAYIQQRILPRPREREISDTELRLKENPDLLSVVLRCSACKVRNIREENRNHMVCWNCKANLCYQCKQRITGPVGKHYHGINTCDQHS